MEKKLQRRLIRLVGAILASMLIAGVVLFYSSTQMVLLDNMNRSNQIYVEQVASSFDIVLEQIVDQLYKLSVYDEALLSALKEYRVNISSAKSIFDFLDSIVMGNRYLYSTYLYSIEDERFFASDRGASYSKETFFDQSLLPVVEQATAGFVDPRIVPGVNQTPRLIASVVIPIPLSKTRARCVLVVNIDMEKLYTDIMKKNKTAGDGNIYLCGQNGRILVGPELSLHAQPVQDVITSTDNSISPCRLSAHILSHRPVELCAEAALSKQNWIVQFQNVVIFDTSQLFNQYLLLLVAFLLLCLMLAVSYLVIKKLTTPIHTVISEYNDIILRDILMDNTSSHERNLDQLGYINRSFLHKSFSVAAFEAGPSAPELFETLKASFLSLEQDSSGIDTRLVPIRASCVAIIFNFSGLETLFREKQGQMLSALRAQMNIKYPRQIYLCVSTVKNGADRLPAAYRECQQLLGYKLALTEEINSYGQFSFADTELEYPIYLERRIVNNLMVGNEEACMQYTEKFLSYLLEGPQKVPDIQIKNIVFRLQNEILKKISSLPISIKVNSDLIDFNSTGELQEWFHEFMQSILEEIKKKNAQDESVLLDSIFQYIDKNICQGDFNLNSLSYQFSLNRNYLARLIKEETGKSFNDYVNSQKVELAKKLLGDHSLTVEAIAHETGFTYAHYFIKIFKSFEGVTPGQYRDALSDDNNA